MAFSHIHGFVVNNSRLLFERKSRMKILAVGAHLDDIEIACGGTLAKAIENGHEVKVLIMSKSGYTNIDGKVQRENDVAVREGTNALHALGIQNIEILVCITNYNPDVIFTHHPFDTHQAHAGVSNATIAAARRRNTVFFYEPITPSGRSYVAFKPDLYVDIEDTLEKKLNSLREHKSEYNKFSGEDWVEGVRCRCGFRGYEIGKKFAEAFEVLRIEMDFGRGTKLIGR